MASNREIIQKDYTADSITILEGLQAVRMRPAMYIGSTDTRGLHHLVYEVIDNSIDEAMAGFCTRIDVVLHLDNSITVRDNGRGIPVDIHPKEGVPAVQVVMTKLHAGGKFDNDTYKVSGGLHGVGLSCVNALSEQLEVTILRGGYRWKQKYSRGVPLENLQRMGESDNHGTTIRFKADEENFETTEYSYETLKRRFEELAYLNKGLEIHCTDERTSETHLFKAEGGIHQFVKDINSGESTLHSNSAFASLCFSCQSTLCSTSMPRLRRKNLIITVHTEEAVLSVAARETASPSCSSSESGISTSGTSCLSL